MNLRLGALALLLLGSSSLVLADRPRGSRGHGYHGDRGHHGQPRYRGYTGAYYPTDHGVTAGRCHTDVVLAAAGAVGGGVVGHRMGTPEDRVLTTVVGAVVGGVLGRSIGRALDDRDRACMGHALELAPVGRDVRWRSEVSHVDYVLTPVRDLRAGCREFEIRDAARSRVRYERVMACRSRRGEWVVQGGGT